MRLGPVEDNIQNSMDNIQNRIEELRNLVRKYDTAYYGRNESLVSDIEYDRLYEELVKLEKQYPQYDSPYSPTHRIGSDLTKTFPKVTHRIPMMSIDNTYSEEELKDWITRTEKSLNGESVFLDYKNRKIP